VKGALSGGGPQINESVDENRYELQEALGASRGKHTMRFGASVKHRDYRVVDRSNFGGTFSFASLADFNAARPSVFTRNMVLHRSASGITNSPGSRKTR
jgi:hypothetical protein